MHLMHDNILWVVAQNLVSRANSRTFGGFPVSRHDMQCAMDWWQSTYRIRYKSRLTGYSCI